MQKISSKFTFFAKYFNPAFIALCFAILTKSLIKKVQNGEMPPFVYVLVAALGVALAYFIYQKLFPLMDEVHEQDGQLLLRRGSTVVQVKFSEIADVTLWRLNPPIIILHLTQDCIFGKKLSFVPHMPTFSFQNVPTFDKLKSKVAQAKKERV